MATLPKVIGISGNATVGKDLFFKLLSLRMTDKILTRFALADELKLEADPFILSKYGFSIFNCTSQQKEKVRPFLVSYGNKKRRETNGRHWIDILDDKIKKFQANNPDAISCVCDIRDNVYENDEADWIKDECGGILVHIKKYKFVNGERVFTEPINVHEAKNEPALIKKANYRIMWEDVLGEDSSYNNSNENFQILVKRLNDHIEEFIKWLNR